MVIQDDSEAPMEVSVKKTPHLEAKRYVIVKNHVRELLIKDHTASEHSSSHEDSSESEKSAKVRKPPKKDKNIMSSTTAQENLQKNVFEHTSDKLEEIQRDLEELRKEYHECFNRLGAKLEKIIQAIDPGPSTSEHNLTHSNSENKCHCKVNTKIIFNENGEQSITEPSLDKHVCPNKLKRKYSDVAKNIDIHNLVMAPKSNAERNLAVEYEEKSIKLPKDLVSLSNILQDPSIAISYRNKVIEKLKAIKEEHLNDIRFNRPAMIEKLKGDPDNIDFFEFKGANLSTLQGYPDWK